MQIRRGGCRLEVLEQSDRLEIRLSGEIDHHGAVGVRSEIDGIIAERRPKHLALELSGIDFMDSSGIGLIMGRYARLKAIGGELTVKAPSERVRRILNMAGIERIVRIEDSREERKNEGKGN